MRNSVVRAVAPPVMLATDGDGVSVVVAPASSSMTSSVPPPVIPVTSFSHRFPAHYAQTAISKSSPLPLTAISKSTSIAITSTIESVTLLLMVALC